MVTLKHRSLCVEIGHNGNLHIFILGGNAILNRMSYSNIHHVLGVHSVEFAFRIHNVCHELVKKEVVSQ